MAHSFSKLYYHIIFSTKNRQRTIVPEIEDRLHGYIGGIVNGIEGGALSIGGIEDHVHLLVWLKAKTSVAEAVNKIKSNSSGLVHEEFPAHRDFAWQTGYSAFTVSHSAVPAVTEYIANQKTHHRKMTFEDEFLAMLNKHAIEYDRRFVFD